MIAKITLENFFSFGEATSVSLRPDVNVLVGINGSGKSNFLKAFQLLHAGMHGRFEQVFLSDWGGFPAVANASSGKSDIRLSFEFDYRALNSCLMQMRERRDIPEYHFSKNLLYEIQISKVGNIDYALKESIKYIDGDYASDSEVLMSINGGSGVVLQKKDGGGNEMRKVSHIERSELALYQLGGPNSTFPLFVLKQILEEWAIYEYFDTSPQSPVRQARGYDVERQLLPDGSNLATLLQRMRNKDARSYEEVEEALREVNPFFKDLSFELIGSKILLSLREKNLNSSVTIERMSDGTLRYLLMLAIFKNAYRGSLICIEEPETGLHPDMMHAIAELMKKYQLYAYQTILTTHEPLLLNRFDLENIFIFEKNERNQTVVMQKGEEEFKEWQEDYLPGQLWMEGKMGGTRW